MSKIWEVLLETKLVVFWSLIWFKLQTAQFLHLWYPTKFWNNMGLLLGGVASTRFQRVFQGGNSPEYYLGCSGRIGPNTVSSLIKCQCLLINFLTKKCWLEKPVTNGQAKSFRLSTFTCLLVKNWLLSSCLTFRTFCSRSITKYPFSPNLLVKTLACSLKSSTSVQLRHKRMYWLFGTELRHKWWWQLSQG